MGDFFPHPLHAALAALPPRGPDSLLRYLSQQRWFGKADHAATQVTLHAVTPLSPEGTLNLAQVYVRSSTRSTCYQIPLCICHSDAVPMSAVVMAAHAQGYVLADALFHAPCRDELGAALLRGGRWRGPQGVWHATPAAGAPTSFTGSSRRVEAEQSNTSIIFADEGIFKLYRRLEVGTNPDHEMVDFLSQTQQFAQVPRLLGSLQFTSTAGDTMDAGILQAFVPNAQDGWSFFLAHLRQWMQAGAAAPVPLLAPAFALGRTTRAMHDALAAQDHGPFAPQPVSHACVQGWLGAARKEAEHAFDELAVAAPSLPAAIQPQAQAGLRLRAQLSQAFTQIGKNLADGAGARIRHHGDYHLGQILRTQGGDFKILDFEGEPLRPLATRRAAHSPLRDVAGMLRSFAYAAATVQAPAAWQEQAEQSFTAAYLQAPNAPYLPRQQAAVYALLRLFTLEKTMYELRYELSHRPTWVGIPLRGLQELVGGHS